MDAIYTEADVERFMREALEAAAKRCEQMAETCRTTTSSDPKVMEWLKTRSEVAVDLAHKIRALEVRRK